MQLHHTDWSLFGVSNLKILLLGYSSQSHPILTWLIEMENPEWFASTLAIWYGRITVLIVITDESRISNLRVEVNTNYTSHSLLSPTILFLDVELV